MKKIHLFRHSIAALLLTCAGAASGQSTNNTVDITSSAVPFLRIAPDARSTGMGNMGLATSPDANSGLWNLAKTPFADSTGSLAVNYSPWLRDITESVYLLHAGGYYKLDDKQAISANIRYFSLGNLPLTDHNGQLLKTSYPREMSFDVGYARKLTDRFGIGVAFRYINSSLVRGNLNAVRYKAATAVAGDVSLFYSGLNDAGQGFTAGLALSNLGSRIAYRGDSDQKEFLPANLGLGAAYTFAMQEDHKLMLGAEVNKLMVPKMTDVKEYYETGAMEAWFKSFSNNTWRFSGGAEYSFRNAFSARLGYVSGKKREGSVHEITAGIGGRYRMVGMNLSYLVPTGNGTNRNPLSNTLRIGLTVDFAAPR
ncbi:type IX secretion system outer membrane channel protein PorV [Chitinophaga caseinilytica]|uniref:Type IX secretion system outer membrane channel protein PorV n=1 Tax=Chitinophaga caseinilytica TaxID=2267521 RepID=A0ABZ2Z8W5_9BACT